ncbi:TNFAIP3-interacting protein 3 [Anomaloglossus baeobatrachus]|uniref:TNFAIP3-interacting protein 3 n=1 Tax=Anomaloglossus baeobatrachus TaxID=238106 RepID=UPI003F505B73
MEDKNTPHGQVDEWEITKCNPYWNTCLELERCDSIELNPLIKWQIQQSVSSRKAEESLPGLRQKLSKQSTLSHHKRPFNMTTNTRLNHSTQVTSYEDLKTKNEVLLQQIKIYEEDFNKERADNLKLTKENKELQQIIHQLKQKLHI